MDWTTIEKDIRKIRQEDEVTLALRRGSSSVSAQAMRIVHAGGRAWKLQSDAARQAQQAMFILGEKDMDIEVGDRLNYFDLLVEVVFIQPNRQAFTIAEAIAVV